jgi:SP family xylose:H+ symportor-like MFS transporter
MTKNTASGVNGFVLLLTFVASLGGLLFGYDTAVISGTTGALQEFFVNSMFRDAALASKIIAEFKIVSVLCFAIVDIIFISLLFSLFNKDLVRTSFWGTILTALLGIIVYDQYLSQGGQINEGLANSIKGFVISSALFGCIIGGGIAGYIGQKYGRKNGLIMAALLLIISAFGSALPESINITGGTVMASFVLYRIIGGIGVGIASMLSPMYIAEISPADIRGKLVSWNQFSIIFGMLVVYFVNYFIARGQSESWINDIGWRWMFASELFPGAVFLILLFLIPESPRFLVMRNEEAKALNVLNKIVDTVKANQIIGDIRESLREKSAPWLSYGGLVIVIGVLLSAFQQFVGINVVLYYAPEIFKNLGGDTDTSLLQTIIVGAINLLFTVLAIMTVDKIGRKKLQIIGAFVMAVSMLTLGTTFYLQDKSLLPLFAMLTYVAGFAMSWGPVVWVLLAEIFPNSIKGALSLAVAVQWFTNYLVSWTFPMMNDSTYLTNMFNHGFAYWVYGVMAILAAIFMVKLVPETKGKKLEEMEKLWGKKEESLKAENASLSMAKE